jgi:hypothetical protein
VNDLTEEDIRQRIDKVRAAITDKKAPVLGKQEQEMAVMLLELVGQLLIDINRCAFFLHELYEAEVGKRRG